MARRTNFWYPVRAGAARHPDRGKQLVRFQAAYLEMKVILTLLLQPYQLELVDPDPQPHPGPEDEAAAEPLPG
ncbi:MAG: hypothetical protein ACLP5E_29955, partial [Streptosporangiaceae bacterium]